MKKLEAELAKAVEDLLRVAEETDAAEDARHGEDQRGDELPEDLQRAESRIARIRAAKAALAAEAKAQPEAEKDQGGDDGRRGEAPHRSRSIVSA